VLEGVLAGALGVLAGVELDELDEVSLEVLVPFVDDVAAEGVVEVVDLELEPRLSVL
jgi:hypothetical protein